MPESLEILCVETLSLQRNGQTILSDVTLGFRQGECWAVVGPTGSGKTTLLQALAGQLPVQARQVTRRAPVAFVSFREESRQFSYTGYFYQQRYHATMSDGEVGRPMPTVRDFLGSPTRPDDVALIERLGLGELLDMALLKLSNGQTRKARLAKALLQHPAILLIDNPFVGLDTGSRADLANWLNSLVADGLTLLLVTEPANLPACVTHVLALEQGRTRWAGPVAQYVAEEPSNPAVNLPQLRTLPRPVDFEEAFRLTNVTVRYGNRIVLDQINWAVRAGERWALLGPNGAGKSVMLSLLYGDHPQAYANDVRVFGHRRGKSGQSIWDVKRRIGFVSPELHLYFPQHLTVRQVALTGLTDTITVPAHPPIEAGADLSQLLDYFGISSLLNRPFGTLSAGEQRLTLLIRAFLKNPPVLILDEPFQALDARLIQLAWPLLDSFTDKTILFVTHDRYELPLSVNRSIDIGADHALQKPEKAD